MLCHGRGIRGRDRARPSNDRGIRGRDRARPSNGWGIRGRDRARPSNRERKGKTTRHIQSGRVLVPER